jgi:hypothetical protein
MYNGQVDVRLTFFVVPAIIFPRIIRQVLLDTRFIKAYLVSSIHPLLCLDHFRPRRAEHGEIARMRWDMRNRERALVDVIEMARIESETSMETRGGIGDVTRSERGTGVGVGTEIGTRTRKDGKRRSGVIETVTESRSLVWPLVPHTHR